MSRNSKFLKSCTLYNIGSIYIRLENFARGGGGKLSYMGYIGMCRCEGCGFQAVYSRIGYINQSVESRIGYHFSGN